MRLAGALDDAVLIEGQRMGAEPSADDLFRVGASGDRAAFSRVFLFYAPRVKAFMRRRGAAEPLAEDLAQEAMSRVWRHAAGYDPAKAGMATWIFVIARNVWIDEMRRGGPAAKADCTSTEACADTPESAILVRDEEQIVRNAVLGLPQDQQEALHLAFFNDLTHAEISERLNLPLGTVKSRIRLALNKIRRLISLA